MKSSLSSRSLKLLGLAVNLGRKEITQTLKEQFVKGVDEIASGRLKNRLEQAKLLTEQLSQLKGAAMKAGQLLSLDAGDYFPPEAVEILSKLQGKAEPAPWEELRSVLVAELGEEKIAQFETLSTEPSASASIGQVHRARLDGRDVAVKIQYPGVSDSVDSDLKILKAVAQSLLTLSGRRMDLDELFAELATVLNQEADYNLELANMKEYGSYLSGELDFAVPTPIESHSSRRVLTMSWERGQPLNDWLKTHPSREDRTKIGKRLLDLYTREFWDWGFVQTDPNYGNFLIQAYPLKLVVLDFGATLRYPIEFRREYRQLMLAMGTGDPKKIVDVSIEHKLIDARESAESKEKLVAMMLLSLEPFDPKAQPFAFKDEDYARRTREKIQDFTQSLRYSPPPRKVLFLHRKLGGVFAFLKRLDVELDMAPYWDRMVHRTL
ncbi:MAG: AarF/ABC1/UbiB kinase family protein [Bdellovibrionota bacterium]